MGLDYNKMMLLAGRPPVELEAEVNRVVDHYMAIAVEFFSYNYPNVTLKKPYLKYDLKGTTGGQAWGTHTIRINLELLLSNTEEMLKTMIPHEVAHIVQTFIWPQSTAHGAEWRAVMYAFGLPPDRCHTMKTTPARKHKKFKYTCPCGAFYLVGRNVHGKVQSGSDHYCKYCRTYLRSMEWYEQS